MVELHCWLQCSAMPLYRIYRMKDSPRQQFRWAPHVAGCASVKPRDYEQRGQVEALRSHGNRAVGLRILARLERIAATGLTARAAVPVPEAAVKGKGGRGGKRNR